jgi:hypothetical protein
VPIQQLKPAQVEKAIMTSPQPPSSYLYNADTPMPGDPLPSLLARLDATKQVYDKAKADYDAAVSAVKAEATGRLTKPDGTLFTEYRFESGNLSTPFALAWRPKSVFASAKFREQYPDLAGEFTELKGSWVLGRAK